VPGDEINEIAKLKVDCCLMAIAGNAAIGPTFSCLGNASRLAIASKEPFISGGKLLMHSASLLHTEIVPIDSEHNAIFRCLIGENTAVVSKLILTASGGPFLDLEESELKEVAPTSAMSHPKWVMGQKISVDSATMINKALEIVEATFIFGLDIDNIKPLIHPEAIIHGLIELEDGTCKASLSCPDMVTSISFALNYPEIKSCNIKLLDLCEIGALHFRKPKSWQKRNMEIAYHAFHSKKLIALNVADEIAVNYFLTGRIAFSDIYGFITDVLEKANAEEIQSYEEINEIEKRTQAIIDGL
jgi:1-deoxy-D-xylulose-5-phosphate reductoisomerase